MHPFHPWAGRELEFVKRRNNWRADRVYVRGDADELVSLPAEWTDAVPEDAFVAVAGGRAPFHLEGLRALSELVASLAARCGAPAWVALSGPWRVRQADYAADLSAGLCRSRDDQTALNAMPCTPQARRQDQTAQLRAPAPARHRSRGVPSDGRRIIVWSTG